MTDFAKLYMSVDASGMLPGEQALERLADKAGSTEKRVSGALDGVARKARTSLDDASAAVRKTVQGFDQTAVSAQKVAQQTNAATGQMANLTSQFNDIAVMMAAGQNPIQLAMQQGTQINQIFTQMGGGADVLRLIGASLMQMVSPLSLLTLGSIALGAAATQAFSSMGSSTKDFKSALDDLSDSLGRARDMIGLLGVSQLHEEFGSATEQVKAMARALGAVSMRQLNDDAKTLVRSFTAMYDGNAWVNKSRTEDMVALGLGRNQTRQLAGAVNALGQTDNLADRLRLVTAIREKMDEWLGPAEGMNDLQFEYYAKLLETEKALTRVAAVQKEGKRAEANADAERMASAQAYAGSLRQQWEARAKLVDDEVKALNQQAEMNRVIAMHGADSRQATTARVQAERDAYAETMKSKGATGDLHKNLMDAWDAANGVASVDMNGSITLAAEATDGWAAAMAGVRAELEGIIGAINALGGGAIANAAKTVELQALQAGKTRAQAARERKEFELGKRYEQQDMDLMLRSAGASSWAERLLISGQRAALKVSRQQELRGLDIDASLAIENAAAAKRERTGGGKKSGGRSKADREAYSRSVIEIQQETEAFLAQADAIARIATAGGDWERALEVIRVESELLAAAQRSGIDLTPEVTAGIREMAEAYVDAEDKVNRAREAMERGQDAFKDLAGSVLDGADAMKKALANLLLEMAKVQMQKAVIGGLGATSWGGSLMKWVGGMLSFDGGGYTGDGARSGGLDGKGGFMAMLHPNETVVDHTKGQSLGGGGTEIIVRSEPGVVVEIARGVVRQERAGIARDGARMAMASSKQTKKAMGL